MDYELSIKDLNAHAAQAVKQLEYMRMDPDRLQAQPNYLSVVGGYGKVTVSKLEDQLVAVKEIRITGTPANRARFITRFARELKVWAPLDHPNLLELLAFHLDSDLEHAFFVCPFYPHGHIGNYLERHNPNQNIRHRLVVDIALGLQYLHKHKIVHGDLKPTNVLVSSEVRALLGDYGLAKMIEDDGEPSGLTTSSIPYTTRFASPELITGGRHSFQSDIWAWGCLFLQIVANVTPYMDAKNDVSCILQISQGNLPADIASVEIVGALKTMLLECWNQKPQDRPGIGNCVSTLLKFRDRASDMSGTYMETVLPSFIGLSIGSTVGPLPCSLVSSPACLASGVPLLSRDSGAQRLSELPREPKSIELVSRMLSRDYSESGSDRNHSSQPTSSVWPIRDDALSEQTDPIDLLHDFPRLWGWDADDKSDQHFSPIVSGQFMDSHIYPGTRDTVYALMARDIHLDDRTHVESFSIIAEKIKALDYHDRLRLADPGITPEYSGYTKAIDVQANKTVTIKMLQTRYPKGDDKDHRQLLDEPTRHLLGRELLRWIRLEHPRILPLLGFAFLKEEGYGPCLVTIWCSRGDLSVYLGRTLDANRRLLNYQIAEGVAYLHSHTPPIVHSDLRPYNILISESGDALICGFGLPKPMGIAAAHDVGYMRYSPKEFFREFPSSTATDVYAFGCVALEIMTHQIPFAFQPDDLKVLRFIMEGCLPGTRNERPILPSDDPLWDIIEGCWVPEPEKRLSMVHIMNSLQYLPH